MELGTEVLFTRLTGSLVFKNPKCKTCYQIVENSIFIYLVLPKTGNPATFPSFKKIKKGVEKTGKYEGSCCLLLRTPRWATLGAPGCVSG